MTYTIRKAAAEDATALLAFSKKLFASSRYLVTTPEEFDHTEAHYKKILTADYRLPHNIYLLALQDEKIVGRLFLTAKAARKRIAHRGNMVLGVDETHRGKGVGTALMQALMEWVKMPSNPIQKIELGTLVENQEAVRLYEKFGFVREGIISGEVIIDGKKFDGLLMGLWVK